MAAVVLAAHKKLIYKAPASPYVHLCSYLASCYLEGGAVIEVN